MTLMNPHYERLMRLIAEARKQQGLERQVDLIRASGLSKSTIRRLDRGEELGENALRAITKALGWTGDSAEAVLNGGEPTPAGDPESSTAQLERRYRHTGTVTEGGRVVKIVDDMLFRVYMAGGVEATFEDFDRTRRRVFKVLEEEGIRIADRHTEAPSGTGNGA